MKDYEVYSNICVQKNSKVILRLDGRKFHSLANYLDLNKPYDENFSKIMVEVAKDLYNEFSPSFIYTFSDEINILLSEIPFSGRIEKLDSVFSSIASSSFTYHLNCNFKDYFEIAIGEDNIFPISFDSRIIPIMDNNILDYFKWRQDEAWRNCINAYGIWALNKENPKKLANDKIKGLKSKDIHQLLFERGINLNDVDTWKKRGIGLYKKSKKIKGFNPIKNQKTESYRNYLYEDWDLAIFDNNFKF